MAVNREQSEVRTPANSQVSVAASVCGCAVAQGKQWLLTQGSNPKVHEGRIKEWNEGMKTSISIRFCMEVNTYVEIYERLVYLERGVRRHELRVLEWFLVFMLELQL